MDLRIIVSLLICALRANANDSYFEEILGCEYSEKQSVYNCPNSTEPNFILKCNETELVITCENKYKLESLPGQTFSIFNNFDTLRIRECNLSALAEFGNKTNNLVPHRQNLEFGSFDLPRNITIVEFRDVSLFRMPEYLFKERNNLTDVLMSGNEHNIKLPRRQFSNLPKLSTISIRFFGLTHIPNDSFSNSTGIKTIDLSGNPLQQLPEGLFNGLTNLEELILESNGIHTIPSFLFHDLKKLSALDLSNNEISNITK